MNLTTTNFDAMTATHDFAHPRKHELPDTYPKGRRCVHETNGARCITRLHQYHAGPWCHAHEGRHLAERLRDEPGGIFHCGACGNEVDDNCQRIDCVLRP